MAQAETTPPITLVWQPSRVDCGVCVELLVAVAIGVAVTVGVIKEEPKPAEEGQEQAVAAQQAAAIDDTAVAEKDTVPSTAEPVLFEDAPLGDILEAVSAAYGVTVSYRTSEAAGLHLYYKLDPRCSSRRLSSSLTHSSSLTSVLTAKPSS